MKKALAITLAIALTGGLFSYAAAHQGRGGHGGQGNSPGNCREDSRGMRIKGHRCCENDGMKGPGRHFQQGSLEGVQGEVDQAEEASTVVASFLEFRNNPNLKVGAVKEVGRDFEVEIVTLDGSLANKVFVEKATGRIIPAYR